MARHPSRPRRAARTVGSTYIWEDPVKLGLFAVLKVSAWDDGRGVYVDDPDGHRLEILTRPYGSGGTEAEHVHPLVAPTIEGSTHRRDIH